MAIVIFLSIFAVNAWLSFDKEIKGDPIAFFAAARAINESGKPVFYNGEQEPPVQGLWHPPLYIHLLALIMRVFPDYLPSARSLGILCLLITSGIIFLICKEIDCNRGAYKTLALSAIFILMGCPLFIQGAFVFDIDFSILPVLLLLFLLGYLKFTTKPTVKKMVVLTFLFALVLWAKLTTPLIFPLVVLFYHMVRREWRMVFKAFLIFTGASLLFILTWWLYSEIVAVPFSYPFWFTLKDKFLSLFSAAGANQNISRVSMKNRLISVRWDILIVTPLLVVLYLAVFFKRLAVLVRGKLLLEQTDLLHLISFGIIGGYVILYSSQTCVSKYIYPALPLVAILMALEANETLEKIIASKGWVALSIIMLGAIMGGLIFPEMLSFNLGGHPLKIKLLSMLLYSFPLGLVFAPLINGKIKVAFFTAFLVTILLYNGGLGMTQCLKQSASPNLMPVIAISEKGFKETVKHISLLDNTLLLMCHRDVGYYWPGHYIDIYSLSRLEVMNYIQNSKPDIVVTSYERQSPVQDSIITMCRRLSYAKMADIGSFSIYKASEKKLPQ